MILEFKELAWACLIGIRLSITEFAKRIQELIRDWLTPLDP